LATWSTELTSGCFARAKADEPMFVLLSRDRLAPWLVHAWALLRAAQIYVGTKPMSDFQRCDEAHALARQMKAWRKADRVSPARVGDGRPVHSGKPQIDIRELADRLYHHRATTEMTHDRDSPVTWSDGAP
jgi:hypothetical protein